MIPNQNSDVPPGWVGGFAESNPAFAYPNPDFTSLEMYDNLDHIPSIKRQQKVIWPEFSWETIQGKPSSRCFQMFAPDISRVGYDNTGRIWSIMCPQQGSCAPNVACLNVEITVTGQRGWVDETNRELAADMEVEGTIWFSPGSYDSWFVRRVWNIFSKKGLPFPSSKANAIKVTTYDPGNSAQPIFPGRKGQSTAFEAPDFAKHPEAWTVGNIQVAIGPIQKTGHEVVDIFNQKVLDIFNAASGNILQSGNVLTWNVWFTAPELVDTKEWAAHAEKWRKSIDADHGAPGGNSGTPARYADGSLFEPFEPHEHKREELEEFLNMIESRL